MKIYFYCSKKSGFWKHGKHKNQKHTSFHKHIFSVFVFKNKKQFLKTITKQTLYFFWQQGIGGGNVNWSSRFTHLRVSLMWMANLTPKLSSLIVWFHAPTRSPKEKFLSFILLTVVWCEHSSISSCLVQPKKAIMPTSTDERESFHYIIERTL